jgi:hypothetical protein
MTAHAMLQIARRRRAPAFVLTYLEDRAVAETLEVLNPSPPSAPVWPWLLLALAAGVVAGATLIRNAEPIAQVVDAGGEE